MSGVCVRGVWGAGVLLASACQWPLAMAAEADGRWVPAGATTSQHTTPWWREEGARRSAEHPPDTGERPLPYGSGFERRYSNGARTDRPLEDEWRRGQGGRRGR